VFFRHAGEVEPRTLQAQNEFFRNFFVYWAKDGELENSRVFRAAISSRILLINLIAAHISGSAVEKKIGIS